MKLSRRSGFTLIELIIVIAIIAILAAVVIPQFTGFQDKARASAVLIDAKSVATSIDVLYAESQYGEWPGEDDADEVLTLAGIPEAKVKSLTITGKGGFVLAEEINGKVYYAGRADYNSEVSILGGPVVPTSGPTPTGQSLPTATNAPTATTTPTPTLTPTATPTPTTAAASSPSASFTAVKTAGTTYYDITIVIDNNTNAAINGWKLEFDYNGGVNSIWIEHSAINASISGTHFSIEPSNIWQAAYTIPAKGSVTIKANGNGMGSSVTNAKLSGVAITMKTTFEWH